jgi:HEAT repeat protein
VSLLGDASAEVREHAAGALRSIAIDASLKVPVYEAGAVPPLVRLLGDASAGVREHAAAALRNIAVNVVCRANMKALGVVGVY